MRLSSNFANCVQTLLQAGGLVKTIFEIVGLHCACKPSHGTWACEDHPEIVGLRWRVKAILMEGRLVKTILEDVAKICQLLVSHPQAGWACEDHPWIVGLHWRM